LNEGGSFKSSSLLLVDPDFFTNAMLLRSQLKAPGPARYVLFLMRGQTIAVWLFIMRYRLGDM
jgi:hypothetical protein